MLTHLLPQSGCYAAGCWGVEVARFPSLFYGMAGRCLVIFLSLGEFERAEWRSGKRIVVVVVTFDIRSCRRNSEMAITSRSIYTYFMVIYENGRYICCAHAASPGHEAR